MQGQALVFFGFVALGTCQGYAWMRVSDVCLLLVSWQARSLNALSAC